MLKQYLSSARAMGAVSLLDALSREMGPLLSSGFARVRNFLMVSICMQNANRGGILRNLTHGDLERVTEAYNGHFIMGVGIHILSSVLSIHNIYNTTD